MTELNKTIFCMKYCLGTFPEDLEWELSEPWDTNVKKPSPLDGLRGQVPCTV